MGKSLLVKRKDQKKITPKPLKKQCFRKKTKKVTFSTLQKGNKC